VLLPGQTAAQGRGRLVALLEATPGGQTFSAGVATWDPGTDPSALLFAADVAMYNAKSQGRNRVCVAVAADTGVDVVRPEILLQPIVDLATREPVAVEALSRFPNGGPSAIFAAARLDGTWAGLEAAAITAALQVRPADLTLSVNVSLDGLGTSAVRDALSGDLTGVILEITEDTVNQPTSGITDDVQTFRDRGAIIAIDDWGKGYSNLDRLLLLCPEIVKIDISLVHNLDHDYHRAAVQTICDWADLVGARICAEGVETEAQWRVLQSLGVHLGQGWFFGRPVAPGLTGRPEAGVSLERSHAPV
jgi:diguanylate cyclase